jgi:hypothetical protein
MAPKDRHSEVRAQISRHRETTAVLAAADKERFEHAVKLCLWQCTFGAGVLTILMSVRTWLVDVEAVRLVALLYGVMVLVALGVVIGIRAYHECIEAMEWRNLESLTRITLLEMLSHPEGLAGDLSTAQVASAAEHRETITKTRAKHEEHLSHATKLLGTQAHFLTVGVFAAMFVLLLSTSSASLLIADVVRFVSWVATLFQ